MDKCEYGEDANFPYFMFGRKIENREVINHIIVVSFLCLVGKQNERKEILICSNLLF